MAEAEITRVSSVRSTSIFDTLPTHCLLLVVKCLEVDDVIPLLRVCRSLQNEIIRRDGNIQRKIDADYDSRNCAHVCSIVSACRSIHITKKWTFASPSTRWLWWSRLCNLRQISVTSAAAIDIPIDEISELVFRNHKSIESLSIQSSPEHPILKSCIHSRTDPSGLEKEFNEKIRSEANVSGYSVPQVSVDFEKLAILRLHGFLSFHWVLFFGHSSFPACTHFELSHKPARKLPRWNIAKDCSAEAAQCLQQRLIPSMGGSLIEAHINLSVNTNILASTSNGSINHHDYAGILRTLLIATGNKQNSIIRNDRWCSTTDDEQNCRASVSVKNAHAKSRMGSLTISGESTVCRLIYNVINAIAHDHRISVAHGRAVAVRQHSRSGQPVEYRLDASADSIKVLPNLGSVKLVLQQPMWGDDVNMTSLAAARTIRRYLPDCDLRVCKPPNGWDNSYIALQIVIAFFGIICVFFVVLIMNGNLDSAENDLLQSTESHWRESPSDEL